MNKNIRFVVVLSLLLCMIVLMGCPPQAITINTVDKVKTSPLIIPTISASLISSVVPSGTLVTPEPSSSTTPTQLSTITPIPTIAPIVNVTNVPSVTPSTSVISNPCSGGSVAGHSYSYDENNNTYLNGGEPCPSPFLTPLISKISPIDTITDPLFISYTITGFNFLVEKTAVTSIFYTPPTTLDQAMATIGNTKTVEKEQSTRIRVKAQEIMIDTGIETASLIAPDIIKVKIPKSIFVAGFDFSNIKVDSTLKSYSLPRLTEMPRVHVDNVSLADATDPLFVTYTITGFAFFEGRTKIDSTLFTAPTTFDLAKTTYKDTITVEKEQSQNITLDGKETFTDTGFSTAHILNNYNTVKVKIPKSVFAPGFNFNNIIRANATLRNPETAQVGPITKTFLVPSITNVSEVDISDSKFISYTLTGFNFESNIINIDSLFFSLPETDVTAKSSLNDSRTIEKEQSQSIIVKDNEILTDIGYATAHLINNKTIKLKIPKSVFNSEFDFSSIRVNYKIKNLDNVGAGPFTTPLVSPIISNISIVDITDPLFVSYTITGSNFFLEQTFVSSAFYAYPETPDTVMTSYNDTVSTEKNQSQRIKIQDKESFTDTGFATAHLVDRNTIKVKIPKSVFNSKFNLREIKVVSNVRNP